MLGKHRSPKFDRLEALCSVSAMLIEQQKRDESKITPNHQKKESEELKFAVDNRRNLDFDSNIGQCQSEAQCQSYNSASDSASQLNSVSHLTSLSASDTEGISNGGKASFIAKLCEMLNDETSDGLVRWGVEGRSIVVTNPNGFSQIMLPRYSCRIGPD